MSKAIVNVKEKKYFVSSVSVVLKLNSGSLIHLRLSEKLDGTENKLSNEETFKQEFFQDICQEVEGSFEWGGQSIKFILVGYNSSEARTFELVGLVVKKDVIEWFNQNNFKDKKQDYLIYQKSNGGNSWPWFNKVLGNKFEQPNPDLVDKIKLLFPDNACIWRYKDSNNFQFLNRSIAFASRHLPEVQGWCAFDADKPLRLILFEEKKQDQTIPKLDLTWNPSHLFLPNRYSWNRWLDRSCTLSRDLSIKPGQEIALIKQLVSDGSNGEDAQKGQNFQAQNPTRLLFTPGTINIGDRNIFCHTVSYEFKLPAFEEKESPSVTMKIEMDYPERQIGDNEVVSLRLCGKFQRWEKEKDEETKVKIAPSDLNNWGIIDEKDQKLKSGDDAVLYTQILSPTYSDKKYSGIYIKHEKDDEMIVDIHPCGIPLVLGSVQKYRKELEEADITLCGEKLAISVSSHNQSLASAEAIILDNSEIKLNHGKKIFGQAQQKVDFLSQNIELSSSQIEINSGETKINSLVNVSFPSSKNPTPNVPSSPVVAGLISDEVGGASDRSPGSGKESTVAGNPDIQKESNTKIPGDVKSLQQPKSSSSSSSVPEAFKRNPLSSVAHIKSLEELQKLLKSYEVDVDENRLKSFWDNLPKDKLTYNSVPQIIERVVGGKDARKKKEDAIKKVKAKNEVLAPEVLPKTGTMLQRADTRDKEVIKADGGLHGRGGSMSVEHARSWAAEWQKKSKNEKNEWLRSWKSQTMNKTDEMPYVATGKESQKGGNNYSFEVPKEINCETGKDAKLVFNGENLEKATVIAVTGGDEVVFLTGIPNKYIK